MKPADRTVPQDDQPDAGQVDALGEAVPAEDPQAQKGRLQEEGRQTLHGQRGAKDVAHEAGVRRPVHAELELLHDARHHSDGHVDQQQGAEEASQAAVLRLPVRCQIVCMMATSKASPMVTGTNKKW